ncbi:PTS sugar transporter subunit IIA [Vagococcus acidifermentans]|uniref:Mannitol-specific phosphotransferase enzyme IIA component n=1 Tax=Vagococcus acidifermentans TaxID=564710 RepID=A0A430ARK9_9ENTE|nr:PTS sugar transporter subunit IIA [Vagococcus acidifermentans]RSU10690.1 PTS mannitol transporter subunit IIA [Vagococcus acidifermentans]
MRVFEEKNIRLNQQFKTKKEAIIQAGTVLVENGYVDSSYIEDMLKREKEVSTYIGNNVAIPHGIVKSVDKIHHSGISFLQVPEGVSYEEGIAYLVIGIAGKNNEHLEILGKIANVCSDINNVEMLRFAKDKHEIMKILKEVI